MTFRMNAKTYFLTWPQNDTEKDVVLQRVVELWGDDISFAVVCAESHRTGEPHLHCIVGFKSKKNIIDANPVLDSLTGKHGNYQGAKSARKVLRYVCKDGNFVTYGDVPDFSEKAGKLELIAGMLSSGSTVPAVAKEYPGVFLLHKRKIEEFAAWSKRQKMVESLIPWSIGALVADGPTSALVEWLRENILEPRLHRQKQLWIYGPPGIGKSRLIGQLQERLRVYVIPRDEEFYDEYEDGLYDLCVLDEYRSHKTLNWLNSWLDGSTFPIRQKGRQAVKNDNLPVIICSNYAPETCYKESVTRDAFIDRLTVVELQAPFNLFPPSE